MSDLPDSVQPVPDDLFEPLPEPTDIALKRAIDLILSFIDTTRLLEGRPMHVLSIRPNMATGSLFLKYSNEYIRTNFPGPADATIAWLVEHAGGTNFTITCDYITPEDGGIVCYEDTCVDLNYMKQFLHFCLHHQATIDLGVVHTV